LPITLIKITMILVTMARILLIEFE
jgi:hypothetical protein